MKKNLILFSVLLCFCACSENADDPVLTVNPSGKIVIDPLGATPTKVNIMTNQDDWTFSCESEWLKCEKQDTTLVLTATANKDGETRTANLIVSAGDAIPVVLTVEQGMKLEIGDFYQGGVIFWLNPDENATPRGKVVTLREMTPAEMIEAEETQGRALWVDCRKFLFMYKKQNVGDISYGDMNNAIDPVIYLHWEGNTVDDGKKNTELLTQLIDKASEKYADMWTYAEAPYNNPENGCEFAWFRKNIVEAKEGGFDDWYIPSFREMEEFTKKIGDKYVYEICNETIAEKKGQLINGL